MLPQKTYGTMYYVDNMKDSVKFYRQVLAMEPQYESEAWTEFSVADHNLCLHVKRAGEKTPENGILILYKDGVESLFDSMKRDGFDVFGMHQVHGVMYSFHFRDQSKNELSFYGKLK